jgi:hypothetical protein
MITAHRRQIINYNVNQIIYHCNPSLCDLLNYPNTKYLLTIIKFRNRGWIMNMGRIGDCNV